MTQSEYRDKLQSCHPIYWGPGNQDFRIAAWITYWMSNYETNM